MASPVNERRLKDVQVKATGAVANVAVQANSNSIDLGQVAPFPTTERLIVRLSHGESNGASHNTNVNIVLQDSADDTTFANVSRFPNPAIRTLINNAATPNLASNSLDLKLPPHIRRYIRSVSIGEANGVDGAAVTNTIELLF